MPCMTRVARRAFLIGSQSDITDECGQNGITDDGDKSGSTMRVHKAICQMRVDRMARLMRVGRLMIVLLYNSVGQATVKPGARSSSYITQSS